MPQQVPYIAHGRSIKELIASTASVVRSGAECVVFIIAIVPPRVPFVYDERAPCVGRAGPFVRVLPKRSGCQLGQERYRGKCCFLTQIFELQQALEQSEGPGASFYSILGLRPSASQSEIRKAYREKSLEWQYVYIQSTDIEPGQKPGRA